MDSDQIVEVLTSYENEVKNIRTEALQFTWYMRGGLTYDDAMMLSTEDRKVVRKIIDDNLETTKKTGLPFF